MLRYDKANESLCIIEGTENDPILLGEKAYFLNPLFSPDGESKGKNSCVFKGVDTEGEEDIIIKFCKYHSGRKSEIPVKKRNRFIREIQAMRLAQDNGINHSVLEIFDDGVHEIDGIEFLFYGMERADCDLDGFLKSAPHSLRDRIDMCVNVTSALMDLHDLGIYHRDLKGENIFVLNGRLKIGDLGFATFRHEDSSLDSMFERIGPTGRMSPEATNKSFGLRDDPFFRANVDIDETSDVFQLGLLFWYILQGEIATGQITSDDFAHPEARMVYDDVIFPVLQYSKGRRSTINNLGPVFRNVTDELSSV